MINFAWKANCSEKPGELWKIVPNLIHALKFVHVQTILYIMVLKRILFRLKIKFFNLIAVFLYFNSCVHRKVNESGNTLIFVVNTITSFIYMQVMLKWIHWTLKQAQ